MNSLSARVRTTFLTLTILFNCPAFTRADATDSNDSAMPEAVVSTCGRILDRLSLQPHRVTIHVSSDGLTPAQRGEVTETARALASGGSALAIFGSTQMTAHAGEQQRHAIDEQAIWSRKPDQFYYRRLKSTELTAGAETPLPGYQYALDGRRTLWIYDNSGIVQILPPEDVSTLGAGVYPLGLLGKQLHVLERTMRALATPGGQWVADEKARTLRLPEAPQLVFEGYPLSCTLLGSESVAFAIESPHGSLLVSLVSKTGVPLATWRYTLSSSGDLKRLEFRDWYYNTSVIREQSTVDLEPTEIEHGASKQPLLLPAKWRYIDTRVDRAPTGFVSDTDVPDDAELLRRSLGTRIGAPHPAATGEPASAPQERGDLRLILLGAAMVGAGLLLPRVTRRRLRSVRVVSALGGAAILVLGLAVESTRVDATSDTPREGASSTRYGPMEIRPSRIDAGRIPPGGHTSVRFTVRNAETETLELSDIRKSCGCEDVQLEPTTLRSTESGVATVTIENKVGVGERESRIELRFRSPSAAIYSVPLVVRSYHIRGEYLQPSTLVLTAEAKAINRGAVLGQWQLLADTEVTKEVATATVWPPWLSANVDSGSRVVSLRSAVDRAPTGTIPGVLHLEFKDGHGLDGSFLLTVSGHARVHPTSMFLLGEHARLGEAVVLPEFRISDVSDAKLARVLPESAKGALTLTLNRGSDGVWTGNGTLAPSSTDERILVIIETTSATGAIEDVGIQYSLARETLPEGRSK